MPKISVIVFSYNSEKTIETTINSIINQSFKDLELILVDGNSKDKTLEIAGNYKNYIKKWISEPNKNRYDAYNKGVLLSQGNYILFLNSGDVFLSNDALDKISNNLNDAEIICSNVDLYNETSCTHKIHKPKYEKKYMLLSEKVYLQAEFISRNLLETTGGFDTRYKFLGDKEFNLRTIIKESVKIKYINETLLSITENNEILPPNLARRFYKEKSVLEKTYFSKFENFLYKLLFFILNKN